MQRHQRKDGRDERRNVKRPKNALFMEEGILLFTAIVSIAVSCLSTDAYKAFEPHLFSGRETAFRAFHFRLRISCEQISLNAFLENNSF